MGIFGGSQVDWTLELDGGSVIARPGGPFRARIGFRPRGGIEARRIMAALVGREEYAVEIVDHDQSGRSTNRRRETSELWRQEVPLAGPGRIAPGETRATVVEFAIPPDAPPSFEGGALNVRWTLEAWIDVGGRDPRVEQPLIVAAVVASSGTNEPASGERVDAELEGRPCVLWLQPAPLRTGAPFSGAVDVTAPLDVGSTRVDLNLIVATVGEGGIAGAVLLGKLGMTSSSRNGVTETRTLWRGKLGEVPISSPGWHRYAFTGQLPAVSIVTAMFPHGSVTGVIDVVGSRRLRPDVHVTRPVSIVTG